MTIQQRSTLTVIAATVGLLLFRQFESQNRYTFGNAHALDWAVLIMLIVLGATHVFISVVMWTQRERWLPSEASMFRFISVKALLWFDVALNFSFAGRGILLDIAYLYVLIAATTFDMDWRMFRRYVLGHPDELIVVASRSDDALERTAAATERTADATEAIANGADAR